MCDGGDVFPAVTLARNEERPGCQRGVPREEALEDIVEVEGHSHFIRGDRGVLTRQGVARAKRLIDEQQAV